VAETGQPYAFTGDDPLNATDPLGLIRYAIQGYGDGYTRTVDITRSRFNYVLKHQKETPKKLGVTKKDFLNAIVETLRKPTNIEKQTDRGTLLYSGPIELTEGNSDTGEVVLKKMVMSVAINQTNGNLVTSYLTSDKQAIADNWDTSLWIASHPDVEPYRP
jgi:hypothetical protein